MSVKYHSGKFPPLDLDWERLAGPLSRASTELAKYDSFLSIIPDSDILISPMMLQEAVISSKIEGTQATAGEVLEYEAGNIDASPEQRNDIHEIINYRSAMHVAENMLETIPLSGRVLKSAHEILLQGVRGKFKSPGNYRTEDNWIGVKGSTKDTARYVPIAADNVEKAMKKWEQYANDQEIIPLVKTAIAHAEFESIHPFLDGNGRIGRMIIPLMLWNEGLLVRPCFYLSSFFDKNNDEYRDRLLAVSEHDEWTAWCAFFLEAIATQANDNFKKATDIYGLYQETEAFLIEKSKSSFAKKVVDRLFECQVFSTKSFNSIEGLNPRTVKRLLSILEQEGIIHVLIPHSGQRPTIYAFPALLDIAQA